MTDAYAAHDSETEALPAVHLDELGKRDAFMARLERIRDRQALGYANERFDGVDRRLTGDPVPGHNDLIDILPMALAVAVCAAALVGFVVGLGVAL